MVSNNSSYRTFELSKPIEHEIAKCAREGNEFKPPKGEVVEVRSEFIRFLILGGNETYPVHESGITLNRLHLTSGLFLKGCTDLVIFSLKDCIVDGTINLDYARTRSIFLDGTKICKLTANRAEISGSLYLRYGEQPFSASDGVDLSGCVITGSLSARGAQFNCLGGPAEKNKLCFRFDDGTVKGNLLFGKDNIPIEKERVVFNGDVSLQNTHCSLFTDLKDSYKEMRAKGHTLYLNSFTYDSLGNHAPWDATFRIEWLELQPKEQLSSAFRPQPYEQIARTLRLMGHNLDAREIQIAKAKRQQEMISYQLHSDILEWRNRKTPLASLWQQAIRIVSYALHFIWNLLLFGVIAYGYKPARALLSGIAIICLGSILFWHTYASGAMIPTSTTFTASSGWKTCRNEILTEAQNTQFNILHFIKAEHYRSVQLTSCLEHAAHSSDAPTYPSFSAFWFAVDSFIPVLSLRQQEYWIPAGDTMNGYVCSLFLYIYILLGWIVTSLGIAGLLGLVNNRGVV